MTKNIKLSDYVMKFISSLGVKHVFLLPGGGCMHLVDSLGNSKLEPVCCLHEQAVAICADAYSQYNNNIGVALVTTGPGGTNTITGVVASWIDSTQVFIISGQVKTYDMKENVDDNLRQMGNQEVDIVRIVNSITKYAVTVTEPNDIKYHLEKAIHYMKEGRSGPVWIDIPLDVQSSIIDEDKLDGFYCNEYDHIQFNNTTKSRIKKVIELLNEAERPVILVGNGVRLAKAEKEFLELLELLRIPVLTTWRTIDFLSEDHELFFGRPGSVGQRGANFIQQNCDFILTIGTRLDLTQVGYSYENFARGAKKVIVDIDYAEIKKVSSKTKVDVLICLDAKIFIQEMLNNLDIVHHKYSKWLLQCKMWKNKYPIILPEYLDDCSHVNTYALIHVLSELMTENDILVPGSSGSCAEITIQSFKVKKGQRIINSPGLGSMGFGLPASIGACLSSLGRRTICIIGDGGLQHNIQELQTLKRLNLPIKLFILNNNGYASIRNTHNKFFDGRLVCCDPSSGLTFPNTYKIVYAYGLKFDRIINHKNLKKNIQSVLETDGSIVCEVIVDPDLQTTPKLSSYVKSDGSITSKPMEDLYPLLDRKEFRENMIIEPLEE